MVLTVFKFATKGQDENYTGGVDPSPISTFLWFHLLLDEFWWSGPWLYYATGNSSYLKLVTNPLLANQIDASLQGQDRLVVSWDNKLPKIVPRFRLSFINY